MASIELHVDLPNTQEGGRLSYLAVSAEELGFRSVTLPEHPFPSRRYSDPAYATDLDPLTALAFVAARTTSIRLGTSVLVAALRNPFILAKQVASLDALSGGRLDLGIGVGWDAHEFASLGVDFTSRGRRTDEYLALLRHLLAGSPEGFSGEFARYSTGYFQPVRPQGVTVIIGGVSPAAVRRAVRSSERWQAFAKGADGVDPASFAALARQVKADSHGRVRTDIKLYAAHSREVDELLDRLPGWTAAGADAVYVWLGEDAGYEERLERLAHGAALVPALSKAVS